MPTPSLTWVIALAAGLVVGIIIVLFNRLVRARQMAREAWSGIDVQLKRRSDLVPNLVDIVKGYSAHERDTLSDVTQLRSAAQALPAGAIGQRGVAEGALSAALSRLIAVAEAYPDLKASDNFLKLQQQLSQIESDIEMSRRYYNGAVRNLNIMIESFPSNLVAGTLGFTHMEYFQLDDAVERLAPKVSL